MQIERLLAVVSRGGGGTLQLAVKHIPQETIPLCQHNFPTDCAKTCILPRKMKPSWNYGGDENVGWRSYTKASPTSNGQSSHICFSFQARASLQQSRLIYRRSKREPSRLPAHFRLIKIVSIYIVANNNIMLSVIRPYTEVEGGKQPGKCATTLYNSAPDNLAA